MTKFEPTKNQLTWSETSIPLPLSRRDYFAALAMQGLLAAVYSSKEMLDDFTSDSRPGGFKKYVTGQKAITENALNYADALIKALDANKEGCGDE